MQSLASRSIFSCSNYETWSKLTIKASEQRQHCYLGTDSNVRLAYPLQNWNKKMAVQFGKPSWLNSVSFETNLKYTYLSTVQEEEQIVYDTIASCLHLLQEKN